jgi:tetratricopeptide (TPR) repeat protein
VGNPGIGGRPGVGNPGIGGRPGVGNPGIAGRPGAGVGIGAGAALLPGLGNRPGLDGPRPSQLPARGNAQERRGDLENRLSQGQDRLNDFNRDDIREDWQDRYDNIYDRHDNWHHGNWNGNAGEWWNHMWDDHTALMAFGTTMWGINRAAYAFGYWGYDNPYYSEPYPIGGGESVDYSQPIAIDSQPVETPATDIAAAPAPAPGIADFDAARQAFYEKDYSKALASCNKALTALPNDPIIHEFRSLILFAQGKYRESAAGLYSVLSVGPGWDWTTLISLYPDENTYLAQRRKLEDYLRQSPKATDARFVLSYHYLTGGHKDAATSQLKVLYKANPADNLVKQLLIMTGGPEAIGAPTTTPEPTNATAIAIPSEQVIGKWRATSQGNKFALELTKDGNFVWSFSQGTQVQSVKGVYAMDGNTLAMEPDTGGTMLAELTPPENGAFHFQMLGAPPDDAGLKFSKGP